MAAAPSGGAPSRAVGLAVRRPCISSAAPAETEAGTLTLQRMICCTSRPMSAERNGGRPTSIS